MSRSRSIFSDPLVSLPLIFTFVLFFSACRTVPAGQRELLRHDAAARKLLAQMTLDEKIGQMIQVDQQFLKTIDDIETYHLGSLLSGGSSDPKEGNSLAAWTDLYDRYQRRAVATRLAIPLLYGVDAVHGHSNVVGAVVFPHNIGLGCSRDPRLIREIARATALETRASGIQWAFAPCVAVVRDIRWGRTYESFSEDPKIVTELGAAAVRGLQGDLDDPETVLACAKHFIGDGGTAYGSAKNGKLDQGDTRLTEAELRAIHLPPYMDAINEGVASIMPSYSSWNGLKCSASKRLLTDILKRELGFQGFLISDYNAIDQIDDNYKTAIGISINAGMDMAMVTERYPEFFNNLKDLVHEGHVSTKRIDDAVLRILRVKIAMGLMDRDRSPLADRGLAYQFGSEKHRELARHAIHETLVLLKNENKALPLRGEDLRIHVAGKAADDLGLQCGGWTVDWQGKSGAITEGTTILEGIRARAMKREAQVSHSADGSGAAGATVGIAVIGEQPYAEGKGDVMDLALAPEDVAVVKQMKAAGIPVVVVLISGRPLILKEILGDADAILAAWLPGTEGAGIADVLFGDEEPKGKLSFSWPASMDQVPLSAMADKPLYPLGHGLEY